MNKSNRRASFFANALHREMFLLVFFSCLIPTVMTAMVLYRLIFHIITQQIGIPEAIALDIVPAAQRTARIMAVALPVVTALLLFYAYRVTHAIVGPFDRIVRELGERAQGTKSGYVTLRKGDKFRPLVDQINLLLDKITRRP